MMHLQELKDMRKDYSRDLRDTTDELFGNIFQSKFSEISDLLLDETEKFDKMQLSPKVRHDLTEMINAIADTKYKLAELEGVREFFGASEDVVSSAEQSLQSRVIAGLMSESDARMKLRHVIGEQGKMLETKLLPVIKQLS